MYYIGVMRAVPCDCVSFLSKVYMYVYVYIYNVRAREKLSKSEMRLLNEIELSAGQTKLDWYVVQQKNLARRAFLAVRLWGIKTMHLLPEFSSFQASFQPTHLLHSGSHNTSSPSL